MQRANTRKPKDCGLSSATTSWPARGNGQWYCYGENEYTLTNRADVLMREVSPNDVDTCIAKGKRLPIDFNDRHITRLETYRTNIAQPVAWPPFVAERHERQRAANSVAKIRACRLQRAWANQSRTTSRTTGTPIERTTLAAT